MSDVEPAVLVEDDGPVRILRLNRPEVMNALSPELDEELFRQLAIADRDDDVRAVILTGVGRAFCAGAMMGSRSDMPETRDGVLSFWWNTDNGEIPKLFSIMEMKKPVIGAINGWCMGRGFWLALATDVTFAAESAVFAQPEVRHVSNTSVLFAALCGWKNAHRYGLTGDHFDANEAYRIGVVNEVVPDAKLMETALAFAHRVAKVPRPSVRINKAVTNMGLAVMGLRPAMTLNGVLSVIAHSSSDTEDASHLVEARASGDMAQFIKTRDEPFRPEPGGPRSKPA